MLTDKKGFFPLMKFENLTGQNGLLHFVTTRSGGFSMAPYHRLNLGFKTGDDTLNVSQNRRALVRNLMINGKKLVFPVQTHSDNIKIIDKDISLHSFTDNRIYFDNTDALVTSVPGICISVLLADCLPILLYDPSNRVIAVIHAGWRGTVKNISGKTVELIKSSFGSDPENIIACIGPSISKEHFETGQEVVAGFEKAFPEENFGIIERKQNGKANIDLKEANKRQLMAAGIDINNIEISDICTYEKSDWFFSHRASGGRTGRFAAGIMLVK